MGSQFIFLLWRTAVDSYSYNLLIEKIILKNHLNSLEFVLKSYIASGKVYVPFISKMDSAHVRAKLLQSCLTLCKLKDCSPPGSSFHVILQARILVWVAMPSSRGFFPLRGRTHIFCVFLHWQAGALTLSHLGSPQLTMLCCYHCSVAQSCPTLCNPMDYSMPGLSVAHHLSRFAQVHVHCILEKAGRISSISDRTILLLLSVLQKLLWKF